MTTPNRQVRGGLTVFAMLAGAVVAGCGGSSAPPSGPRVAALADQVVNQDTTVGPIPVRITNSGAVGSDLSVTAMAADGTLVPPSSIVVAGTGTDRTLTLMPAPDQTGTTHVTVTVRDTLGHVAIGGFQLTVNPVFAAFTQYATTAFAADADSVPVKVSGLTFVPDADDNVNAFSSLLQ